MKRKITFTDEYGGLLLKEEAKEYRKYFKCYNKRLGNWSANSDKLVELSNGKIKVFSIRSSDKTEIINALSKIKDVHYAEEILSVNGNMTWDDTKDIIYTLGRVNKDIPCNLTIGSEDDLWFDEVKLIVLYC